MLRGRLVGVLWRYAAQVRGRQDARAVLIRDIGNENLYEWPGPVAKFLIGLSEDQAIEMTTIIPCNARDEVRGVLMAQGAPWRTDNCLAYPRVTTVSAPARVIE